MPKKVIQPQDKYVLRLPDGMRERIRAAAELSNRSMNAEIVDRLEQSFSFPSTEAGLRARIATLNEEAEGLHAEIRELQDEAERGSERRVEFLAEIRGLRIERKEFDQKLEKAEAQVREAHQILRNYEAHSEQLKAIETELHVLNERLAGEAESGE